MRVTRPALVSRGLGWRSDVVALALPLVSAGLGALTIAGIVTHQPWALTGIAAALLVAGAAGIVRPRLPAPTGEGPTDTTESLVLVAVNLKFDSTDPDAGVRSALAAQPDVLVVSEVTQHTDRLLSAAFPKRVVTVEALRVRNNGVAIYSAVPIDEMDPLPGFANEVLRVRVNGPAPFVLYAVHLPRPVLRYDGSTGLAGFEAFRAAVRRLDAMARAETDPVVITGDLNLSDRTSGYVTLAEGRRDALRTGWAGTTFLGGLRWRALMLRIDHMFIPADWCAQGADSFSLASSDHRGIRAQISPGRAASSRRQ